MDRRTFMGSLAGGLLAVPLAAEEQDSRRIWRIGYLAPLPRSMLLTQPFYKAFLEGLRELGYVEGRHYVIELRGADWRPERLPDLAADLVRRRVDVIVVPICGAPLDAARRATETIPIIVATCNDDLVASGVIASMARPGGNITGNSKLTPELAAKRMEFLKAAVPRASRVAVLWNPDYSAFSADWRELRAAAERLRIRLQPVEVRGPDDFEQAFVKITKERADALITFSDNITYNFAGRLAEAAAHHRLPSMSPFREVAAAGGLMSYGPNLLDMVRHASTFVDKILKGAKPGDLPIEQPIKFELVINLKTAKAIGLTIPQSLLLRADEVIQ